jgi:hypothetical protein
MDDWITDSNLNIQALKEFKNSYNSENSNNSNNMSKRKLDVYITPTDIKSQCKQLKDSWKESILASGGLALKFDKSSSSPTLPTAADFFIIISQLYRS